MPTNHTPPKPVLDAVNDAIGALSELVRSIRAARSDKRGGVESDDIFSRLEKAWAALKGEEADMSGGDQGGRGRSTQGGRGRSGRGRQAGGRASSNGRARGARSQPEPETAGA